MEHITNLGMRLNGLGIVGRPVFKEMRLRALGGGVVAYEESEVGGDGAGLTVDGQRPRSFPLKQLRRLRQPGHSREAVAAEKTGARRI